MNGADPPRPHTAQRLLAGLVALPLTWYALGELRGRFDLMTAIFGACAGTLAVLCWWFALRGHLAESRRHMKLVVIGGFVLGGIAFAVGFFGPILWAPDANQGPLLGIFITGPLGFVVGCAAGWLYARIRQPEVRDSVNA